MGEDIQCQKTLPTRYCVLLCTLYVQTFFTSTFGSFPTYLVGNLKKQPKVMSIFN